MRKVILLLALIAALVANAQLRVESFSAQPFDISASRNERLDLNGNACALVKVRLPIQGCKFEGNVIDAVYDVNEYWVWLTKGTKRFDIKCPGTETLSIYFANVSDIESLEGGVTYDLRVSGYQTLQGNAAQSSDPGANYLVLSIEPKNLQGLSVKVDGQQQSIDNQTTTTLLDYGTHAYTVEAMGYEAAEGVALINADGTTTVNVSLQSAMARLSVKSATPGASIAINSQPRGTGSWSGELAPGRYIVEVSKTGYRPYTQTVTLDKRDDRTVDIPALSAVVGTLSVDYKPVGSTITLDGQNVGKTPAILRDITVGQHTVGISSDGYEPATQTVTVREAETATLNGSLALVQQNPQPTKYAENTQPTKEVLAALRKKYEGVGDFSEGFAQVTLKGKWGFVDVIGREIIPLKYDFAYAFSEGLAVVKLKGKWGFIDKTGKEVISLKYDIAGGFSEGFAMVELNRKRGFVDKIGKEVIPLKYDWTGLFSEGLAAVKLKGKWGYIDIADRVVIPLKYKVAYPFSEGLAPVKLNGKWGYIDKTDRVVIPLTYDDARSFENGKALVKLNGVWGYIDKTGNFTPE